MIISKIIQKGKGIYRMSDIDIVIKTFDLYSAVHLSDSEKRYNVAAKTYKFDRV